MQFINKIITSYNKTRTPEIVAKLVNKEDNTFLIKFIGSFCGTCGINDYFDDFIYKAESFGINLRITNIKQINGLSYVVKYIIII